MIKVQNLSKTIDNQQILNAVSLEIPDGSFYGIIGESGSGKSTLLKCLNGLANYESGLVFIDQNNVKTLDDDQLRKLRFNMGMIFQHFGLLEQKTVFQNIALPLELWGGNSQEISERVHSMAEMVKMESHLNKKPRELSGGQKQRVAIARALISKPKYLLCDECTSALDPKNSLMIMNLLARVQTELSVTIILVTHDMQIAKRYCSHLALLHEGEVQDAGLTQEIIAHYPKLFENIYAKEVAVDVQ